jgi:hypothetical protein
MPYARTARRFGLIPSLFAFPTATALLLVATLVVAPDVTQAQSGHFTPAAVNFSSVAVGSTSAVTSLTFTFDSSGTINAPSVLTQGAPNLDFTFAGNSSCTYNGANHIYQSGDTCTVNVKFKPLRPGTRYGAVVLYDSSANAIATAYLQGTGDGPLIVFPSNYVLTTFSNIGALSVALDSSGNIYLPTQTVQKVPAGCSSSSCITTLGGGLNHPTGVAVDGAGNVYVADIWNGAVKEMPPGCASSDCVTTLGGGFSYPEAVAVDGRGNVYVGDGAVKQMPAGCASSACVTTLGGGISSAVGLAVDGVGNVYAADYTALKEIPPGCATSDCVITRFAGPYYSIKGVALGASGDIYVTSRGDYGEGTGLLKVPAGCTTFDCAIWLLGGFLSSSSYADVAVDGSGSLYVVPSIQKLDPSNPPSLQFGTTEAGRISEDSPQTVTIENIGNQDIIISKTAYGKDFPENSGVSTDCPHAGTVSAGTSCTLSINFSPLLVSVAGPSTSLSESVSLTDNNLNGTNVMQSISVSGTETAPGPFGYLDMAVDARTRSTTVAQSDNLLVLGWAADLHDGASVSQVQILIDGTAVGNAALGLSRTDVKNYPNSGWSFTYAVSSLSLATHTLSAVATNSLGGSTTLGGTTFTVATVSTGPPFGFVDQAVDASTKSTNVGQAGSLVVSGWAADPQDGAPVSQVQILIDGTTIGNATVGLSRPDVKGYPNSGWWLKVSASGLSLGTHTVSAVATDSQSKSTTLAGMRSITVTTGP